MLRSFLLGKIHRATVTRANLHYVGSITIDAELMKAAGFLENEKVEIYNITNGNRLSTYVIPGSKGEIGIHGAAAHLVRKWNIVIIANYGLLSPSEFSYHEPRIVHVDENNIIEVPPCPTT